MTCVLRLLKGFDPRNPTRTLDLNMAEMGMATQEMEVLTIFPSASILDNFNRADGGPGANWTNIANGLEIVSNECAGSMAAPDGNVGAWNVEMFGDSEADLTITNIGENGDSVYVLIRLTSLTTSFDGYGILWTRDDVNGDALSLLRFDDGEETIIDGPVGQDISIGDAVGIRCNGNIITGYYKAGGGAYIEILHATDSTYVAAGYIGMGTTGDAVRVDNFGGGDYVPLPSTTETILTGRISLQESGFAPGPGKLNVIWSGQSARFDGQRRVDSSRDNLEVVIKYVLSAPTPAGLDFLQRKIDEFWRECQLFEEDSQGEPVWLEYLWEEYIAWENQLTELPAPVWGQLARYLRVLKGETPRWPQNLHTGALPGGVIIGVESSLVCEPFAYSLPQAALTAAGSVAQTNYGVQVGEGAGNSLTWLSDELSGAAFSICGWVTIGWTLPASDDKYIIDYMCNASNWLRLIYDYTEDQFDLMADIGGTTAGVADLTTNFSANQHVHFAITYDGTTLSFYVNGALAGSTALTGTLPGNTNLFLGGLSDGTGSGGHLDGWRIFDVVLTANQVQAIYKAELPIKWSDLDGRNVVGMPPYWWTSGGDDEVGQLDYGILGGVSGSMEALVEWQLSDLSTDANAIRAVWLGRKASVTVFTPGDDVVLDFSGTVVAGAFGGQVEEEVLSGADSYDFDMALDNIGQLRGRVQVLAVVHVGANAVEVYPHYYFAALTYDVASDPVTIPTSIALILYDLGDLFIDWDKRRAAPATLNFGVNVSEASGGATVDLDVVLLLPYPNCRVEAVAASITLAAGDVLIINEREAYLANSSGTPKYFFERRGAVTAEPGKYNYIWMLIGQEGDPVNLSRTATIRPIVTSRWLLPGGIVG